MFCQANSVVFIQSGTTQILQFRHTVDQICQTPCAAPTAASPRTCSDFFLQSNHEFTFDILLTLCHPHFWPGNKTYNCKGGHRVPPFCRAVAYVVAFLLKYIHIYIHTYIHTPTHKHTHTHTHSPWIQSFPKWRQNVEQIIKDTGSVQHTIP
jgi:hypothetical protein